MKSKHHQVTTCILELNEEELTWLKGILQNPIHAESPESEDPHDKKMRKIFWDALNMVKASDEV